MATIETTVETTAPPEFRPPLLIGIDDTDNEVSIGTGYLCRLLAEHLGHRGFRVVGVTRHQHLQHPDIPSTTNNSSCALGVNGTLADIPELDDEIQLFMSGYQHPGADPGLCLAAASQLQPSAALISQFGLDTQTRIVDKSESIMLAQRLGLRLHELGGTGLGIIGALGAVALRFGGHDGRFLDMHETRDLEGLLTVAELCARLPLEGVYTPEGRSLERDVTIDTRGWVRPELFNFRARLNVYPDASGQWITRS